MGAGQLERGRRDQRHDPGLPPWSISNADARDAERGVPVAFDLELTLIVELDLGRRDDNPAAVTLLVETQLDDAEGRIPDCGSLLPLRRTRSVARSPIG